MFLVSTRKAFIFDKSFAKANNKLKLKNASLSYLYAFKENTKLQISEYLNNCSNFSNKTIFFCKNETFSKHKIFLF